MPKIDGNDVCCVEMTDTQTTCTDLLGDQTEKRFTFDYSFWSFDGYVTEPNGYTSPAPGNT